MSNADILRLIKESFGPVQIHFVAGQSTYLKIQAHTGEMDDAQLARFIEKIEERGQHGILYAECRDGKIFVTWERSLKR